MNKLFFETSLSFEDQLATASTVNNPNVSIAKFVFSDYKPNGNKQRVPKEEFPNIQRTAVGMPLKMASGAIAEDHSNAVPLGVITHIKEEDDSIIGLAALWKSERTDDITLLKSMMASGNAPKVSWELQFETSTIDPEGVEDLHGIVVLGSTVVGNPAYIDRTPFIAMSSQKEDTMELDELKAKIAELEKLLADRDASLATLTDEVTSLRSYKASIEQKEADEKRFASIKEKFSSAGISRPDTFFTEKRDQLLKFDDTELDFMIQELVAFASTISSEAKASQKSKLDIPAIPETEEVDLSNVSVLAKELRKLILR